MSMSMGSNGQLSNLHRYEHHDEYLPASQMATGVAPACLSPHNYDYGIEPDYYHDSPQQSLLQVDARPVTPSPLMVAIPTSAHRLQTFFFQRFIDTIWLHSQAAQFKAQLPNLMHKSPALHNAVLALSALYMSRSGVDRRATDVALPLYSSTIKQLQKCLYDPQLAFDDSTLVTTVLIGIYELVDKPGHSNWCTHTRGTAELIKLRGAATAKSGFGRSLYFTARSFEVVRAILVYEYTYLADPEWQPEPLVQSVEQLNVMPDGFDGTTDEITDRASALWILGARSANFQARCAQLKGRALQPDLVASLLEEASMIEADIDEWRAQLPLVYAAVTVPSIMEESPYTTIQQYTCFQVGYQICFAAAFTLLLHRTIGKFIQRDLGSLPAVDQALAAEIAKTSEFLTQGMTTGSMAVIWPLYIASITHQSDAELKWTLALLQSIAERKAFSAAQRAIWANKLVAERNSIRATKSAANASILTPSPTVGSSEPRGTDGTQSWGDSASGGSMT